MQSTGKPKPARSFLFIGLALGAILLGIYLVVREGGDIVRSVASHFRKARPEPEKFAIHSVTPSYISSLKRINSLLLPINYTDSLYRIVLSHSEISKIAMAGPSLPIGAITSRYQPERLTPEIVHGRCIAEARTLGLGENQVVYIMTFGVLPEYQRRGVGSRLMASLIEEATNRNRKVFEQAVLKRDAGLSPFFITALTLHVQHGNLAGTKFYERHGFQVLKDIPNYYTNVEPRGARLMGLRIEVPHCADII